MIKWPVSVAYSSRTLPEWIWVSPLLASNSSSVTLSLTGASCHTGPRPRRCRCRLLDLVDQPWAGESPPPLKNRLGDVAGGGRLARQRLIDRADNGFDLRSGRPGE